MQLEPSKTKLWVVYSLLTGISRSKCGQEGDPMVERDMEDLIASFPGDFFPQRNLVLKGRQRSFAGVGRFDLLFEDQFQTNILMELKAVPARYEDATQVAKYKDELTRRGEKNILMWLVAPQIPTSLREFLDRIGIEYSEIHIGEFRRVAARRGVQIASEARPDAPGTGGERISLPAPGHAAERATPGYLRRNPAGPQVETGPAVTAQSTLRWMAVGYDLQLLNPGALDQTKFIALVDAFEQAVPSRRNASLVANLKIWATDSRSAHWPIGSCSSLLRWVTTSGWKTAVPAAESIWRYLFGQPAPTWYVWNQGRRKYEFNAEEWKVWYDSLPH